MNGLLKEVHVMARGPGGATRQAAALRAEGVTVDIGHLGELMVSLATFGWFPERLPSEREVDMNRDEEEGEG